MRHRTHLVLLVCATFATTYAEAVRRDTPDPTIRAAAAQQTAATTPARAGTTAERQFRAWLAAFNAGNREQYRAFLQAAYPAALPRVDGELGFREMTGGFDVVEVERATDTAVSCLLQERAWDQFVRAEMEVEPAPPHRITRRGLRIVPRPAARAVPPMSERAFADALRAKLTDAASKGRFSGAALVARRGRVVVSAAHGQADRARAIPNTLATRFRMGSMNKMFTATAVLQLVQAGQVRLDAPIGTYLAGYPNADVASKVTVHHLLTHTGGTGNIFGPEFDAHRLELRALSDYVTLYGKRPLAFEPGSKWEYSNYGFLLLGVIVERVSGQSYYDFVRDHIFAPAGMTSSGSEPEDRNVPDRATGYMTRGGALVSNADTLPYRGTSAGGGYTTVEDLLRFATALTGHRLLNAHYTEQLTSGKADTGGGGRYAYGFAETVEGGVRYVGHSGGAPGMNGDLRIYPASGYVVVALVNADSGASQAVAWAGDRLPQ